MHFLKPRPPATNLNDAPGAWSLDAVVALFELPLMDLLYRAQQVHRAHFEPNRVQLSTLLSIKTGGCPEDCAYCPQSAQYDTDVTPQAMLSTDTVVEHARRAKAAGATRFCMGAAWRGPSADDIEAVLPTIRAVKALGLETCGTFGLLRDGQAEQLKAEGLDYYNHNLDTSAEHYGDIISTRQFEDRLDTLRKVRAADLKMCCGGIVGMGESRRDRAGLIATLASLTPPPESVPINALVPIAGTPLGDTPPLDPFEFVRTIACARITMPTSYVRLSAGREGMSDELQALCWLAGANSLFYGETLLTAANPETARDAALFERLGLVPEV